MKQSGIEMTTFVRLLAVWNSWTLYEVLNVEWNTIESGCGSAWLERLVGQQEVAGSNPVTPTDMRA